MVDLDVPLKDLRLPRARLGGPYRSVLLVARLDGEPLGTAALSVAPSGRVSRGRLARELRRQLEAELDDAFGRRGLAIPDSLVGADHPHDKRFATELFPLRGIPSVAGRNGDSPTRLRSVSVVVATCCNPAQLERCLQSILACDYDEFEVIVVENRPGSSTTRKMLAERFPHDAHIHYVEEPCPGYSPARNTGLALANGDLVAFTDDDVVVDPAWVRRCAEAFERADDVDCVTGLILPRELETDSQVLLEQFAGLGKGFRRQTFRLPEARDAYPLLPYTPGVIGSGPNQAVRADVVRALGGFDATLGTGKRAVGAEDLDLYVRLLRAGHTVVYEPRAIVWHEHPDSASLLRRKVYRYGVGFGALLAKHLVAGRERSELLRAIPAGFRYARDPASRKNAGKTATYPRRLDWLERLGMLVGPAAYLVSAVVAAIRRLPRIRRGAAVTVHMPYVDRLVLSSGKVVEVVSFRARDVSPPPAIQAGRAPATRAPRRRSAQRAIPRPAERAIIATATAACAAAPLLVGLGAPAALRLTAVLALLCLAPGAALVRLLGGRLEVGLVIGVSIASTAMIAQSMLWMDAWWPKAFLYLLAAACLPALVSQLHIPRRRQPGTPMLAASPTARLPSWWRSVLRWITASSRLRPSGVSGAVSRVPLSVACHGALLTVAMVAWAASLVGTNLSQMAGIGLLNALPLTYFVAFGLLLVGFAAAVTDEKLRPKLLGVYALALILVLHGTTPLLYEEPRYAWVYKHLGVTNLIAATGAVDRDIDIWNNWPAFFAANAWFSNATGLAPLAYAGWAQVFFNVTNLAAVRFALRGVTSDERLAWTAAWLFILGNWVAQDYLAPQAFGFVLSLVVLGLCLRCSSAPGEPRSRVRRWLAGRLLHLARPHRDQVKEGLPAAPLTPRGALAVGGLCYLAIVVSHQLSPVMLILGVTSLSLLVGRPPRWVLVAMAAIEVWWLTRAWPFFDTHYSLFDADLDTPRPAGTDAVAALPGAALATYGSRAIVALMALAAVAGVTRRLRAGHLDIAPACLILAPVTVIGIQSYGGEAAMRAYLFALPWLAFFAAAACFTRRPRRLPALRRGVPVVVVTSAVGACLLFPYFGRELMNRIAPDEVQAAVWYERRLPVGAMVVHGSESSPWGLTARYPKLNYAEPPGLTDRSAFRGHRLGRADLPRLERMAEAFPSGRPVVLVLSQRQEADARLFGVLPPGSMKGLARDLAASSTFRLVYRRPSAWIFQYVPRSPRN